MIISSIRCWSTGAQVGWMMKTSVPADVLVDLKRHFGVGKPAQAGLPELHPEELGNLSRELRVSAAREDFQFSEPGWSHDSHEKRELVGAEGFEPSNKGSKDPRLTAWPRPNTPGQTSIVSEFTGSGKPAGVFTAAQCPRMERHPARACQVPGGAAGGVGALKQAEYGGSGTRHRGHRRARVDERLADAADRGMVLDHGRLEIVAKRGGPGRPARRREPGRWRAPHAPLFIKPRVGIGARNAEPRAEDHDVRGRQIGQRIDVVAAPEAERGAADQEERHVGADARAEPAERRQIEVQLPQLVQARSASRRRRRCRRQGPPALECACADRSRSRAGRPVLPVETRCSNDAAFHTRLRRSVGTSTSSHVMRIGPRRVVTVTLSNSARL